MLFDKCQDELKYIFYEKHNDFILYRDGIGQYDYGNNLIKEYVCKYDCSKNLPIGEKMLNKALTTGELYNNMFYFKKMGSKIFV